MSPRFRAIVTYRRLERYHSTEATKYLWYSEPWSRHLTAATIAYHAMEAERRPGTTVGKDDR